MDRFSLRRAFFEDTPEADKPEQQKPKKRLASLRAKALRQRREGKVKTVSGIPIDDPWLQEAVYPLVEADPIQAGLQVDWEEREADPSRYTIGHNIHPAKEIEPGSDDGTAAPYEGAPVPGMEMPGQPPGGAMPPPEGELSPITPQSGGGALPQQQPPFQESAMFDFDQFLDELLEAPGDTAASLNRQQLARGPMTGGVPANSPMVQPRNYAGFSGPQAPPPSIQAGGPGAVRQWQQQMAAVGGQSRPTGSGRPSTSQARPATTPRPSASHPAAPAAPSGPAAPAGKTNAAGGGMGVPPLIPAFQPGRAAQLGSPEMARLPGPNAAARPQIGGPGQPRLPPPEGTAGARPAGPAGGAAAEPAPSGMARNYPNSARFGSIPGGNAAGAGAGAETGGVMRTLGNVARGAGGLLSRAGGAALGGAARLATGPVGAGLMTALAPTTANAGEDAAIKNGSLRAPSQAEADAATRAAGGGTKAGTPTPAAPTPAGPSGATGNLVPGGALSSGTNNQNNASSSGPTASSSSNNNTIMTSKDWGMDWSDYNLLYESDRQAERKARGY